jgi:Diacylglycerol acyltransferase
VLTSGYHPHGFVSMGAFGNFGTEGTGWSEKFPGITNSLLTLNGNFRIPLYKEYLQALGLASVSRRSCEALLYPTPNSLAVLPLAVLISGTMDPEVQLRLSLAGQKNHCMPGLESWNWSLRNDTDSSAWQSKQDPSSSRSSPLARMVPPFLI